MFKEDGTMQYCIAAQRGEIVYPKLFYDRLKRWKNLKLLKEIEEDPFSSFKEKPVSKKIKKDLGKV